MSTPNIGDKAPLADYVAAIVDGVLAGIQQAGAQHPDWEFGAATLNVRCALRPELDGSGKVVRMWADMDVSRSQQVSEIPVSLRRKAP
jgi:hypothetical protein